MEDHATPRSLRDAQARVDHWIRTVGVRYFSPLTNLGILLEECGELARVLVRTHGEQSFKSSEQPANDAAARALLADEMADVLWVLMALANQTGVDLEAALEKNFSKKTARDGDRHRNNPKLQ